MNTHVALKILLILSILLQSFVAVSATMETHQLDAEHLQTIHDHENDHTAQSKQAPSEEHDIDDCHHCGHCSGNHTCWIILKAFSANLSLKNSHKFHPLALIPDGVSNRLYRPPIT